MKLNERSVVQYATCGSPPDKSGFLMKKSERSGAFQRRWCVLKANLLFFFEERGRREPLGLVVLEGCTVELCEGERVDFAFAVRFGLGHAHTLAADTQRDMEEWAKALARASFQYLRLVVRELERQLEEAQRERSGIRPSRSTPALRPSEEPDKESGVTWSKPAVPQRTSSETPREKEPGPAAPPHSLPLPKENGVSWNKPSSLANGVAWEGEGGAREHATRPPPVPPRRRSPPAVGTSEVSPGTTCFSKLHDWYGKEVDKVRTEWLQSQ